ncbi:MAG: pilin [bacterium]|nr:pilin [bacterium]
MLNKIKQFITVAAFGLLVAAPLALPANAVFAADSDIRGNLCGGVELDPGVSDCNTATSEGTTGIQSIVSDIVNILSWVVGVVAVIMIIIGGFKYITSGGNDSNVASAKNTILYAIIGLVIVALAQFIVRFVIGRVVSEK